MNHTVPTSPSRKMSQDIHASPIASSPLSQYPFPNQDNIARRGNLRRGSTQSSISSSTPAIAESGPNAISTLLQPPIIRTGLRSADAGFKPPTQKDIPPVTLTNITHVDSKSFHPYLSQVGSLYEAFQRAKNEIDGGDAALFQREKKDKGEDWEAVLTKKLQRPAHSRTGSTVSSITSPLEPPLPRRRSSGQRRHAVTPLSTIPTVYAEEDFHLENPRTFDIVSEHSEIVRDPNAVPSGRKSLASNAILQEKLSWYLDTVEVHLISSISTASSSFFSALGSLRELHDEAEESVVRIQKLRKELAKLDKEMAVDGLKVVKLKQRRDNVRRLAEAILQLDDIVSSVRQCEDMVEKGEIDGALDDLDDVERLMVGKEPTKLFKSRTERNYEIQDLRRIKALEGALDDLNQLRFRAGRGYEGRFHNCLLGDIRKHVADADTNSTLQRWGNAFSRPKPGQRRAPSVFPSYMSMSPDFRIELEQAMQGLTRARYTTPAVTSFRNLILREMKGLIQKQLPSSNDDDTMSTVSASTFGGRGLSVQEKSSIIARNLRALDFDDWYQLLVKIYTNVSESLRRLSMQVKILLDVTSTMDQSQIDRGRSLQSPDPGRMLSPGRNRAKSVQAEMQQALDLSSLLGEAVDAVQNRIVKVLRIRSQQNIEMVSQDFIRYVTLNRLFAEECEAISGRSGQGLRTVIDTQIRDYVSQWGSGQQQRLLETMDNDKWEAKDFGEPENIILSRVIEGSTNDAVYWLESAQIWQQESIPPANGQATNGDTTTSKEKLRSAVIDEQKFILPECPIATMRTIEAFQHLTVGIPGMGQELASTLLDCLKQFNSRTSQLVLGAGATRTAGLKSITTKHLALSSQGVSFIITLMPYVREFFRRYVPSSSTSQVLTEFDKVKRSLQEHQNSVHEKLVDMMSGRATVHIKTMKETDWEALAKSDSNGVSRYMEALTKETATFHRLLTKPLPEGAVLGIMGPVFSSYRKQWEDAFNGVELKSEAAKNRMLADAEYFDTKISRLEGAADLGKHIVGVVKAKEVKSSNHVSQGVAEGENIQNGGKTAESGNPVKT